MATWLKRSWNLLSDQVWGDPYKESQWDSDYFDSDIGPLLYAVNPERDKLEQLDEI